MRLFVLARFLCTLALLACALGGAQEPQPYRVKPDTYAELTKAPERERARANPMANDPTAKDVGAKLFGRYCASCHGNEAEGTRKGPSLRVKEMQDATPGTLFWVLTNGVVRRGMPPWSRLPEAQRWALVSYLKSLDGTLVTK